MIPTGRQVCSWFGRVFLACIFLAPAALAQDAAGFDDIAAAAELDEIAATIQGEDISNETLADVRGATVRLETGGTTCVSEAAEHRQRLESRFEPLKELDSQIVGGDVWDQRQAIKAELDAVIARQARCIGIVDRARELGNRITTTQNALSQMYLSSRSYTIIGIAREFPLAIRAGLDQIGTVLDLELAAELAPIELLWMLIFAAVVATSIGLFIRHRFAAWYEAAGGDAAPPALKFLVPKPVAEFAPLWSLGLGVLLALHVALAEPSDEVLLIRLAWCVLVFAVGSIIINWGTGPLSPSANIAGLIPEHVRPVRLRLRLVVLALCFGYALLGDQWSMVRVMEPFVAGRVATIFLVGIALLSLLDYARNVPGLRNRFRFVASIQVWISSWNTGSGAGFE